jgi:hypothetical protein
MYGKFAILNMNYEEQKKENNSSYQSSTSRCSRKRTRGRSSNRINHPWALQLWSATKNNRWGPISTRRRGTRGEERRLTRDGGTDNGGNDDAHNGEHNKDGVMPWI